jgi:SAM-dependent methyltransferase
LRSLGHNGSGIDPSRGMLSKAVTKVPAAQLALARAEQLPFAAASFDRVFSMNAVHHFDDPRRAFCEARRVLRPGGAVLSIALDPSAGLDEWSLYEFFAGTRERDLERFPRTADLRTWMAEAGFEACETVIAERIDQQLPARDALALGALNKSATSQLSELSDAAYRAGIEAIEGATRDAEQRGEVLMLSSRLHLFATVGTAHA